MYVKRTIEKAIKKNLADFPAVALSGFRQTGKSTLLKTVYGNAYQYVTFDDPLTRQRALDDPELFLSGFTGKVIFDEIQYVPQLLSYIKIRIDEKREVKGRYILTGSQQFNLIKELGDTLAGRIAVMNLMPFSYCEIIQVNKSLKATEKFFEFSCLRGLFPEISLGKTDVQTWYGSYLQTYIERDIRTVYNISNLREFTRFLQLLAARCSQILNLSNYANDLGVSVNTIKNWLSVLEASQVIYVLPPYYNNLGKRITKSPKIYWMDCGLVCYLTGLNTKEHLFNGPMAGALFENLVIQETVKYFYHLGMRPNLYYIRTNNNLEIDLLIEHRQKLFPFEIKLTKTPNIGMAKSIEQFKNLFSKHDVQKGHLISLAKHSFPLTRTVSVVNFSDYFNILGEMGA